MTGLQFLSATIGQLIWPVLVLILVLVLRNPIKSLMTSPRLRRVKAGPAGIEVEIDRSLDEARRELIESQKEQPRALPSQEEQQEAADFLTEMRRLAEVLPRAVVMESYARLKHVLRQLVEIPPKRGRESLPINVRNLGRWAVQQELLTPSEEAVLDELRVVRNAVAHSPKRSLPMTGQLNTPS